MSEINTTDECIEITAENWQKLKGKQCNQGLLMETNTMIVWIAFFIFIYLIVREFTK